jgi:hypothetical protein
VSDRNHLEGAAEMLAVDQNLPLAVYWAQVPEPVPGQVLGWANSLATAGYWDLEPGRAGWSQTVKVAEVAPPLVAIGRAADLVGSEKAGQFLVASVVFCLHRKTRHRLGNPGLHQPVAGRLETKWGEALRPRFRSWCLQEHVSNHPLSASDFQAL